MVQSPTDKIRFPKLTRGRAAAAAFGLGATLALSPMVLAENPAPLTPAAPQPMTAPVALIQQQSFAPLVKKVLPAVVNISVTQKAGADQMSEEREQFQGSPFQGFPSSPFDEMLRRFFEQQNPGGGEEHAFPQMPGGQPQRIALGSGFIVDPSGYVVTNNHVVGDAGKVEVILQDKTKYTAKIVGRDPKTDLAVLKIKADKPLPYVSFGDSSAAQVGDWVMAVGNPFGLGGTVTTGIISARGRDINEGPYDDFLQIDAPINRGNSGGPTFNLEGQVIGINTAIYSPNGGSVGIGFAVPSNVAKNIIAQLEEHGKIVRGWLGVQIQEVTPAIAASLGLHGDHGALVAVVNPDGPAAKAGLKQGDVVLAFNGSQVDQLHDLPRLVATASPGSEATVTVWRDGRKTDLQAKLGELPDNSKVASAAGPQDQEEGSASQASALGMRFEPLTNRLRQELHIAKGIDGVVVAKVDNGSAAENVGLADGDVIVSVNQQPVHTPQEAAARLTEVAHSSNKTALLLLNRHGVTQYVGMSLGANQG
ncbi:MAG TPA: DegQ family serine endoprotease [Stellaceae bacterium]|jgi:serine protease Do|nr:DegQ family serine endoprotease [Stellaceae bacterium]